jgi:hypothetical protein
VSHHNRWGRSADSCCPGLGNLSTGGPSFPQLSAGLPQRLSSGVLIARSGGRLRAAPVSSGAPVASRAAIVFGETLLPAGASIVPQTPVTAGAALKPVQEPHRGCRPKLEVAFDESGCAAVQLVENPFSVLRTELVLQLVARNDSYLGPHLFANQHGDRFGQLPRVDNTDRIPGA